MPTRQIQIEECLAPIASSMTSTTNQADVPRITIGSVCLTERAYFQPVSAALVDCDYVLQ